MNPNKMFLRIDSLRQEMGLPRLADKNGQKYTLAILQLGDHETYGMNTWGVDGKASGLQKDFREFFNELARDAQKRQFPRGIKGSVSHAEGDALVDAYNRGITDTIREGTMYVDRAVCDMCRGKPKVDGTRGLASLGRLLTLVGMSRLVIYDPTTGMDPIEITPEG